MVIFSQHFSSLNTSTQFPFTICSIKKLRFLGKVTNFYCIAKEKNGNQ